MNKRFVSVFVFALAVSGVATYLVYHLILTRIAASAHAPSSSVIVAARDLAVGTLIRDTDLKTANWTGPVPPQAISKREDIEGRGVVANIFTDEPFLESRLAPKGAGAGLSSIIPVGKRAVAVRVNDVVGVAGFVVPGMRVDVLISGTPPSGSAGLGTETKTILQNIEVLSAGQNVQKDAEGKPVSVPVVTLLVTPEQAEVLSLAASDTRIQLVLRNKLDTDEAKTPGVALANLFRGGAPPPVSAAKPRPRAVAAPKPPAPLPPAAAPPQPQVKIVEVIHGARKSETKFQKKPEVNE